MNNLIFQVKLAKYNKRVVDSNEITEKSENKVVAYFGNEVAPGMTSPSFNKCVPCENSRQQLKNRNIFNGRMLVVFLQHTYFFERLTGALQERFRFQTA